MAQTGPMALRHIRELLVRELGLTAGMRVLEAGCGAGAVLSLLQDTGAALAGADFSAPHIEIARQSLPGADLRVAEAARLPWEDACFDAVFSYGVFLYFPDLSYAERVLEEMLRVAKPGAPIMILDIPNAATREECETARRAAGASMHPPHCYYPSAFFEQFSRRRALPFRAFGQQVPGYWNSLFRFNVLFSPLPPRSL
jgi:ubiquinone/menaquinone biosynthesis C-methylase UbiE